MLKDQPSWHIVFMIYEMSNENSQIFHLSNSEINFVNVLV